MLQFTLLAGLAIFSGSLPALERQIGPATVPVGDFAELRVPEGHFWFPPSQLPEFFSASHTLSEGDELGVLGRGGDQFYALIVRFDPVGKVADPATHLSDLYLEDLNRGLDAQNAKRAAIDGPQIGRIVWGAAPTYDPKSGRLTFSTLMDQMDRGVRSTVANYGVELFGKRGVVRMTVVCDQNALAAVAADVQTVLDGFQFMPGEGYFDADGAGPKASGNGAAAGQPFSLFKFQLLGGALVAAYLLWKKRADVKRARLEALRAQRQAGQVPPPPQAPE